MSTNVHTISKITGRWDEVRIEATMFTGAIQLNPYRILSFPDTSRSFIIEKERIESDKELHQLFSEFAQEDMELAELGMDDYNQLLLAEDIE